MAKQIAALGALTATPRADKKKQPFFQRRNVKKNLFVIAALAIPVLHFLVFWVYVNFDSLLLAFQNIEGGREVFTFSNFKEAVHSLTTGGGDLNRAFRNTFVFFVYGVIVFPLGIFWAYFFYRRIALKSFFRVMFYVPQIVSAVVISGLFKYMINPEGPIGVLYRWLTGSEHTPAFLVQEEYALKTVIIYGFWTGFAGQLLLLSGAFARIPMSIIESANLDGIGWWRELWQICVPLIWPTLSTIIIVFSTTIFTASGEILLLTNGQGGTTTISFWLFAQVKYYNSYYLPSALGLMMTIVATPISLFTRWVVNKVYAGVEI